MIDYFKKNKRVNKKKQVQWYRPGHGKMLKYERRGGQYYVSGTRNSQYKPLKYRPRPPMTSIGIDPYDVPITPREMDIIMELRTPTQANPNMVVLRTPPNSYRNRTQRTVIASHPYAPTNVGEMYPSIRGRNSRRSF